MISRLRLVVADDHEASRAGLSVTLGTRGFTVDAEAIDAESALEAVLRVHPDICLLATHLPGGGIRAAGEISARAPDVPVVMLGSVADESELFAALDAGAAGYLLKDIDAGELDAALHGVVRGEGAISAALVAGLFSEFRQRGRAAGLRWEAGTLLHSLTKRQLGVLELLSAGMGTREVASRLRISTTTVRRHVSSILGRLGVDDRPAAVAAYRAVHGTAPGSATVGGGRRLS